MKYNKKNTTDEYIKYLNKIGFAIEIKNYYDIVSNKTTYMINYLKIDINEEYKKTGISASTDSLYDLIKYLEGFIENWTNKEISEYQNYLEIKNKYNNYLISKKK